MLAQLAAAIAGELGLPAEVIDRLHKAGRFHDIGKLWIPAHILEKDGPLTHREWTEIREHPKSGAQLLRAYGLEQEAEWVLHHHERPDGLGYPHGLAGDEIPLGSRILAIANAWSAMHAERPYSPALTDECSRLELEYARGEQFDARLVDLFLDAVVPTLDLSSPGAALSSPGH